VSPSRGVTSTKDRYKFGHFQSNFIFVSVAKLRLFPAWHMTAKTLTRTCYMAENIGNPTFRIVSRRLLAAPQGGDFFFDRTCQKNT